VFGVVVCVRFYVDVISSQDCPWSTVYREGYSIGGLQFNRNEQFPCSGYPLVLAQILRRDPNIRAAIRSRFLVVNSRAVD